jgi:hypothetical protein
MLMRILPLVYLVVGVYLVWNGFIPLPGILELSQGAGSGLGSGLVNPTVLGAPAFLTWTFGLVALATALGFFAIALVVAFGDRILWWGATTPPDDEITFPVAEVVEESVDDLRTDPDPRRAIMGCYRKFERVAADSRLARRPWWTPAEFMAEALRGLPAPPTAVATLTSLFELARFSHHALGGRERDLAIEALLAIKASVESRPADAITA